MKKVSLTHKNGGALTFYIGSANLTVFRDYTGDVTVMDGIHKGKQEADLSNHNEFNEFIMAFAEVETIFLQSKRTSRWWMQLHDGKYVACSYRDYLTACNNDIPERWLRAVERS